MKPPGEKLRRAVERLAAEREERPDEPLTRLVDEVSQRFDLDPREVEWLLRTAPRRRSEGASET